MKTFEIKVPSVAESVTTVQISKWLFKTGDFVKKDQEIVEIDTDKTSIVLSSPSNGRLKIIIEEGQIVEVGQVIALVEEIEQIELENSRIEPEQQQEKIEHKQTRTEVTTQENIIKFTPLAAAKIEKHNINTEELIDFYIRKITARDVDEFIAHSQQKTPEKSESPVERKPMSAMRRKIAERMVSAKNQTAMLTTFNEIDMTDLLNIKEKYQQEFQEKHGIKLGLMSFFTKAAAIALLKYPEVNSMIEGNDIVYFKYCNIGISVSTEKGLVVPVVRNVESKTIAQIEKEIATLVNKARNNQLIPDDLSGGTFTITNGGVFGSLFSTPIINPPQAAILGMHAIKERPVVVNKEIVIRPMMYVALSYDHRIIDGKESVNFLLTIKQLIEEPLNLFSGGDAIKKLLSLE